MRSDASWRAQLLSGARHAAAAAGLGIAWLLLSGAGAHAASSGDLLGGAVAPPPAVASSPASSTPLAGTADGLLGTVARTTAPLASAPTGTVSDLAGTATRSVASAVRSAPALAAPLTAGPLAPLAPVVTPVVTGIADTTAGAVGAAGGAVVGISDHGAKILEPVTAPIAAVLQAPAAPSNPLPEAAPAGGAQPLPPAALPPAALPGPDSADPGPAASATADVPTLLWAHAMAASVPGFEALMAGQQAAAPPGLPALPAGPLLPPLAAPGTLEGQFSGSGGGAGLSLVTAGAFGLAPRTGLSALLRPASDRLPASPAFDPGSTPD